METIEYSVGENAKNLPVDVIKIQWLVNGNDLYTCMSSPLQVDGKTSKPLVSAIKTFQTNHPALKMKHPDGRVDPGGKTLACLNELNNKARICINYYPTGFLDNTFKQVDKASFLEVYALQYSKPLIAGTARLGLSTLLDKLCSDQEINDLRWAAYMLATVKHECADTWTPIDEYGRGKGHPYYELVKVIDPVTKAVFNNRYYGRGYVQLTWQSNYEKMDTALRLTGSCSLNLHPENALKPDIAYQIMSYGMRNGSFSSKKLSDYINAITDYRNARRIINGLDMCDLIKSYAVNIDFLLRFCKSKQEIKPVSNTPRLFWSEV